MPPRVDPSINRGAGRSSWPFASCHHIRCDSKGEVKVDLPCGEWVGYYAQFGQRFPQRMTLEFADGIVRGDGIDGLGRFRLEGEYRAFDGEVRIGWIKTYDGAHSILYVGALEADGSIAGEWRIPPWDKDAFSLLPTRDQK